MTGLKNNAVVFTVSMRSLANTASPRLLFVVLFLLWLSSRESNFNAATNINPSETFGGSERTGREDDKPTLSSSPLPDGFDCAVRKYAYEYAIRKLPWSSHAEQQSVRDALRLQECAADPSLHPTTIEHRQDEAENPEKDSTDSLEALPLSLSRTTLLSTEGFQILRHRTRRLNEEQTGKIRTKTTAAETTTKPLFEDLEATVQSMQRQGMSPPNKKDIVFFFVDPEHGDDGASGSFPRPFRTIETALATTRRSRKFSHSGGNDNDKDTVNNTGSFYAIVLRGGRYYLEDTIALDSRDNDLTILPYPNETPILSGGYPLSLTMHPTAEDQNIYWAKLPSPGRKRTSKSDKRNEYKNSRPSQLPLHCNFTTLFLARSEGDDLRLVWAREPNGHPERDLQPDGYTRANGTTSGTWPDPSGAIHFTIGKEGGTSRNSTVYPWYGEDLDPRGGGNWFHLGGTGDRFFDQAGFWNGTVPMGLWYNASTSAMNTSRWTPKGYAPAIAHVFHEAFWGNWQFEVEEVQNSGREMGQISFSRGGWQEGRGGSIRDQPFFVEGVKEALDEPGEWWLDVPNQVLFYYPFGNETMNGNHHSESTPASELRVDFVAPRLQQIVTVMGENSKDRTANRIAMNGITFSHSATTFLEPYEVPSPGDWSIHRGGAVFLENVQEIALIGCRFLRTGGNALFLSGHAKRCRVSRNEFAWIGDSAVVTVGRLAMADGFTVDTFPEDTFIAGNHFHEIGIHGKQTSALFSALSCRTTFVSNVAYNGPRAGINLNDQFCHGHTIRDNLLFNWVRETQDHGPINTWDRAMYVQRDHRGAPDELPKPTLIPEWAHIERNFIMNGPSGNRNLGNLFPTIDNDDGSSYFYIANNFLVYGGAKNYLGHDKRWISNLLVFPGRWSGDPCAQIWGGENHLFENNTCIVASGDPPIGLDGSMKGFECTIDWNDTRNNLRFVGVTAGNVYYMNSSDQWGFGCGNGTSPNHFFTFLEMQKHEREIGSVIKDQSELTPDIILGMAKSMLEKVL